VKDLHSRIQPPRPLFMSVLRLIELLDLLSKDVENATRRAAMLELGSEWVREKILLRTFFVHFQGFIENKTEVGGRGGSRVSVRHKA
jgi:hypothetical protein